MPLASSDLLDSLGRAILDFLDYRVIAVAAIAWVCILSFYRRKTLKSWPEMGEAVRSALGVAMIGSGVNMCCVFVLTNPPYIEALGENDKLFIGASALLFSVFVGVREALILLQPPPKI